MDIATSDKVNAQLDYENARSAYPEGFPKLPAIPAERYLTALWDLEQEHVWRKSWLCVGRIEELPAKGSYKLFERVGLSIVVVRGDGDDVRAFHNICRHRGAPIVKDETGKVARFFCGYHAWSYDLHGRLVGVTEACDFKDLKKSENGLLKVRCELWGGWLFINCDLDARPLLEEAAPLVRDMAVLGMDKLRIRAKKTYMSACNWKATLDAFIEAYHVKVIHPETVAPMIDPKAIAITLFEGGHARMAMRKKPQFADGGVIYAPTPAENNIDVPRIFSANYVAYNLFPNLLAPIDGGGFPFIMFWPTSPTTTELDFYLVGAGPEGQTAADGNYWQTQVESFDMVMSEDMQFLPGIQKTLQSRSFAGVNVGYQERRIYWLHEEIDRRIEAERLLPGLTVEPLLTPFAEPLAAAASAEHIERAEAAMA